MRVKSLNLRLGLRRTVLVLGHHPGDLDRDHREYGDADVRG